MQKDQIISSWEMTLQHPAASPQTWVFTSDGLILQCDSRFGNWEKLGDDFFRIHLEKLRLCGLPVEYTARLEADFLTLYYCGEEMFVGRRLSTLGQAEPPKRPEETVVYHGTYRGVSVTSVFAAEEETPKPGSSQSPEIYKPWIGVWTPTRTHFSHRKYSNGNCTCDAKVQNHRNSYMVLQADGVYRIGNLGRSGTWRRTSDGRMLLDQGRQEERYYIIRPTPEGSERIGPYRKDGSRLRESEEYTFFEAIRPDESQPVSTAPSFAAASNSTRAASERPQPSDADTERKETAIPTPPTIQEDWREVKAREWRETGRWRGNIGGCWVTSRKHPDDWEHPHNK